MSIDFRSELRSDLARIETRRELDGWLVTDEHNVTLGCIHPAPGAFFVRFAGRPREPFDFETFDDAIDFFSDYRSALELGG